MSIILIALTLLWLLCFASAFFLLVKGSWYCVVPIVVMGGVSIFITSEKFLGERDSPLGFYKVEVTEVLPGKNGMEIHSRISRSPGSFYQPEITSVITCKYSSVITGDVVILKSPIYPKYWGHHYLDSLYFKESQLTFLCD